MDKKQSLIEDLTQLYKLSCEIDSKIEIIKSELLCDMKSGETIKNGQFTVSKGKSKRLVDNTILRLKLKEKNYSYAFKEKVDTHHLHEIMKMDEDIRSIVAYKTTESVTIRESKGRKDNGNK